MPNHLASHHKAQHTEAKYPGGNFRSEEMRRKGNTNRRKSWRRSVDRRRGRKVMGSRRSFSYSRRKCKHRNRKISSNWLKGRVAEAAPHVGTPKQQDELQD